MNANLDKLFGTARTLQPKPNIGITTGQVILIIAVVAVGTGMIVYHMDRNSKRIIAEMEKRDERKKQLLV